MRSWESYKIMGEVEIKNKVKWNKNIQRNVQLFRDHFVN
jgi:hypothetical protein